MRQIKTIGDLRKIIDGMDDDFSIEMRVRSKVSDEEFIKRRYPYPYDTEYFDGVEMDDICTSDRVLCLGVEIGNTSIEGDIINNIGTLKKRTESLDDDFCIEMRVRTKLSDEELMNSCSPYKTEYFIGFEFDDIGYSDKVICFGVEQGKGKIE
jgi:hypothetical protein